MDSSVVQIDFRENASGNIDRITRMGMSVDVKELKIGDYIVGPFCIERKTIADYYASLLDGSLNEQLWKMSHYYDYSFLAVIGVPSVEMIDKSFSRKVFISSLIGSCTKVSIDGRQGQILLLQFETEEDFCLFIKLLHNRSGESFIRSPATFKKQKFSKEDISIGMLSMIEGVGEKKAKLIMNKFGSLISVCIATLDEIMEIKGIGINIAKNIHETVRNTK